MFTKSSIFVVLFAFLRFHKTFAQDSLIQNTIQDSANISKLNIEDKTHQFSYKKLIVPASFISYGLASLSIKELKQLNSFTKDENYEVFLHFSKLAKKLKYE